MGSLKPGASYVYEHNDGVTYAREIGSTEKVEIGRTFERTEFDKMLAEELLWKDIHRVAKNDVALQQAIDRVKLLYYLNKT